MTKGLRNKGITGDHPNYSIAEIGQNTEKSPWDLRRFVVTQTPVNADVKNSQGVKIIIYIIKKYTCLPKED